MRLDNIRILTENFPTAFEFYKEILGLNLMWGNETSNYASFAFPKGGTIGLFKKNLMSIAVGTNELPHDIEIQDKLCLIVEVEDIESKYEILKNQGIDFVNPPEKRPDWGLITAHLRDPDGNLIEMFTPIVEDDNE
jgi:predicted enzyme related to lactoylglutathione lyase